MIIIHIYSLFSSINEITIYINSTPLKGIMPRPALRLDVQNIWIVSVDHFGNTNPYISYPFIPIVSSSVVFHYVFDTYHSNLT